MPDPACSDAQRHEYDADTEVEALGGNRFRRMVSPGYNIGPYPNGGYLLAIATAAIAAVVPLPDPHEAP